MPDSSNRIEPSKKLQRYSFSKGFLFIYCTIVLRCLTDPQKRSPWGMELLYRR
ncbi:MULTISPECIES: hypothetical protein [unclassified Okeania]|uniref:hypothetical protein n=1 Tax=unclassified Okeania TaxID=2634635 RepID=UPI0013B87C70|nr:MULTISPECIES: hypothetical protein [unclassified Okeania]NES77765.1 hypothetical protein [Okeania sp. SIO1H4]NET12837.1 hypothetical protein [Okeania sp. SIO1H6]NET19459.1 hypothetical protein [Okeania sp. SIO1H5]NET94180.1 hypothetical protein [Okeania sp. SIO1H2]